MAFNRGLEDERPKDLQIYRRDASHYSIRLLSQYRLPIFTSKVSSSSINTSSRETSASGNAVFNMNLR